MDSDKNVLDPGDTIRSLTPRRMTGNACDVLPPWAHGMAVSTEDPGGVLLRAAWKWDVIHFSNSVRPKDKERVRAAPPFEVHLIFYLVRSVRAAVKP